MHAVWYQRLKIKVDETYKTNADHMTGGGCVGGSAPNSTAENYMRATGYLQGLTEALRLAEEVSNEMMGAAPNFKPPP